MYNSLLPSGCWRSWYEGGNGGKKASLEAIPSMNLPHNPMMHILRPAAAPEFPPKDQLCGSRQGGEGEERLPVQEATGVFERGSSLRG